MFAAEITFVREVPYDKQRSANQEGAVETVGNEAGYYAFYGSSAVRVSQKFGNTASFNSQACLQKTDPKSYNFGVEAA